MSRSRTNGRAAAAVGAALALGITAPAGGARAIDHGPGFSVLEE